MVCRLQRFTQDCAEAYSLGLRSLRLNAPSPYFSVSLMMYRLHDFRKRYFTMLSMYLYCVVSSHESTIRYCEHYITPLYACWQCVLRWISRAHAPCSGQAAVLLEGHFDLQAAALANALSQFSLIFSQCGSYMKSVSRA